MLLLIILSFTGILYIAINKVYSKHWDKGLNVDIKLSPKEIIEGNKIIFSWGCWGSNKEIAQIVCEALYKFGPVYYDLNDCDEVDFQLFDIKVK